MSVMLSILSSFLLVMVAGGGLRTSLVSAEETIVSNSGRVIAYWQTMLPNTPMPSAIQDLLTPTAGNDDHITKPATNSISTTEKGTHEKFTGVPFHKARKLRPHIKKFQNLGNDETTAFQLPSSSSTTKIGDSKFPYIYGQSTKTDDQNFPYIYGPVMKTEDQKFLYIYGTTTKTDNQKFPYIYNGAKKIDDQKFPYIYGPATKTKDHKFPYIYDPATKPEDMKFPYIYGPSMKPNDQKFPYFYGPSTKTDDQNFPYIYGPDTKTNDQKFPYIYGPTTKPKNRKSPYIYGPTADDQKFPYIYGSAMKPDNHKFPYIYGPTMKTGDKKFPYIYGLAKNPNDLKFPYIYVPAMKTDDHKFPYIYGPAMKTNDQKFSYIYGQGMTTEDHKFPYIYGQDTKNDDQKFPYFYGAHTKTDDMKFPYIYALATETGEVKFPYIYGPTMGTNGKNYPYIYNQDTKTDDHKFPYIYGLDRKVKDHKTTRSKGFPGISAMGVSNVQENGHEGDVHIHGDFTFTEDIVKLGSTIIPYILPSATLGAPLLQRDIADYIPISIRNFNGIMKMFAPVSYSMANDIWSTLNMCEHVRPLKGEKKMCIGSVESMVEFVSSVLGSTRDLRAFSSSQVPNEGVVTKRRYKVVASRRPTESSETATCHGMNFPYAVFMCHAMNPTRVYALTLQSENDGGEGQKMEVLVVCHLDTSGFDPSKMPKGTRPGEAPACHFVGRDTVLWAPVAAAATTTAA
ncbi:hypothetical protein ACQJBY_072112 [Aegilops geniculata]